MDDIYAKPLRVKDLQQYKALAPLPPNAVEELARIEALDVYDYYEVEVRAFVIDPIVHLLGYDKAKIFQLIWAVPSSFSARRNSRN
jgi:hypothetical protein